MSRPAVTLPGANVRIFLNGNVYNEAQQCSWTIDYGENEIYGIDSAFPQEIGSTRYRVAGSVTGVRIKNSGGLQSYNARPRVEDLVRAEYITIRIQDRQSGEDLLYLPNAKIGKQNYQTSAKGIVRLSFDFSALVGFEPLDRR